MFSIPSLAGLLAGAATGAIVAWRRRGNGADMAHYAGVFALIGLLIGIAITLIWR